MIELGPVRESEIVLAFLRAEIDSAYGESIRKLLQAFGVTSQELIDQADLGSDYCNAVRGAVLDCYRGYLRRTLLFTGFPKNVAWRRVELESPDLNRLRYIGKEEHWMSYSQETRSPQRVANRIARGELPDLAEKVASIQERLKRGETLPELVAVEGAGDDLILVEGASRTSAYVGLQWKANVRAFLGNSPLMRNWLFF